MPIRTYTRIEDMTGYGEEILVSPDGRSATYYNGRIVSTRTP